MKASKSEVTYFILSIILIAFAGGIYLFFGNTHTSTSSSEPRTSATSSSSSSEADLEANAQSLLDQAKANPSADAVTNAQAAINKISDEAKKTDLQSQLDAVSADVTNQTNAENAVTTAENEQTSANVNAAQAAIDAVTNQDKKNQLQARLDAVSNAISSADTTTSSATTSSTDNTTDSTTVTNGNYNSYSY